MKKFKGTPGPWEQDRFDNIVHGEEDTWGNKNTVRVSGVALPGQVTAEYAANGKLVTAAPELLDSLTMGQTMQTPEFLHWIADRLVYVHGERENLDFIRSLRERADAMRLAVDKALGEDNAK